MADYVKNIDFAAKDNLPSGVSGKIIRGTEIDQQLELIETAIITKSNTASPTFTGTVTIPTLTVTNTATIGTIDGGTY